jgi:hypothetical protein
MRNHVQIVYWKGKIIWELPIVDKHIQIVNRMKEKSFENLQLLRNHVQIVYRMKETNIWELTIVDKSHSLVTLFKIVLKLCI